MLIGIPDKLLVRWLGSRDYIKPSDEGEGIGIAAGYYIATGKRATVFMSADGFCNALNPITSMVIPENMEMDLVISVGRTEPQHVVMTKALDKILRAIEYDTKKVSITIIGKE